VKKEWQLSLKERLTWTNSTTCARKPTKSKPFGYAGGEGKDSKRKEVSKFSF
jgi:hypothetical protein